LKAVVNGILVQGSVARH